MYSPLTKSLAGLDLKSKSLIGTDSASVCSEAMNASKVDPLPHQIEAVYDKVLKPPRIRFLIADDPGAGKTIMAGLILKELKLRNLAKRILIVVPGHLKDQWRRELKERFEERFVLTDRGLMDAH